jgi:acetoacetyl-CoA reductase
MTDRKKIAYVTGGMGGIGTSLCQRLHQDGFTVIAGCGPSRDHAKWLGEQAALGYSFHASVGNVGDWESTVSAFRTVRAEHGRVDVLVNNAAILEIAPFHAMTMADFDRTMNINLRGAVLCAHAFIGSMRAAGRGSIINVGSGASTKGFAGETHYCAAKFGLEGFSEALAIEARDYNVAVNRLSPGYRIKPTSVTLADADAADAETRSQWRDPTPMMDAFVFLALQDGTGVTGQHFNAFELAERVRAGARLGNDGRPSRQTGLS